MKKENLEFAQYGLVLAVGFSVTRVIQGSIKTICPAKGVLDNIVIDLGSSVLGTMVAYHAKKHVDKQINEFKQSLEDLFSNKEEDTTK